MFEHTVFSLWRAPYTPHAPFEVHLKMPCCLFLPPLNLYLWPLPSFSLHLPVLQHQIFIARWLKQEARHSKVSLSQAPPPSAHACSAAAQKMGQSMGLAALLSLSPAYAITAGCYHSCGLRDDGQAVCWGANGNQQSSPPGGANQRNLVEFSGRRKWFSFQSL